MYTYSTLHKTVPYAPGVPQDLTRDHYLTFSLSSSSEQTLSTQATLGGWGARRKGQGLLLEEDCLFSTVYSCPRLTDHASMGLFPGFIFYSINLCVYFCAKNCVYFKFEKKNCGNLASYLLGKNSKLASPELILINVLLSIHGRAGAGACFSSHGDRFAVVIHILSPVPRAGQENIFYYDWPA